MALNLGKLTPRGVRPQAGPLPENLSESADAATKDKKRSLAWSKGGTASKAEWQSDKMAAKAATVMENQLREAPTPARTGQEVVFVPESSQPASSSSAGQPPQSAEPGRRAQPPQSAETGLPAQPPPATEPELPLNAETGQTA